LTNITQVTVKKIGKIYDKSLMLIKAAFILAKIQKQYCKILLELNIYF